MTDLTLLTSSVEAKMTKLRSSYPGHITRRHGPTEKTRILGKVESSREERNLTWDGLG